MPDTTILKTANGWIDRDEPNVFHPCRRLARDARRGRNPRAVKMVAKPTTLLHVNVANLSQLQRKLYNRFTSHQGIPADEAFEVVRKWTYNKAASYGHIRAAGATPKEAEFVVNQNDPTTSLMYGNDRAAGIDHLVSLASLGLELEWLVRND